MAGVVAMAAVIEDFEATQPCKKLKKDDDPPPTRTITNYFMPLTRSVEKPFSPPRSNNIMDYFRKTSPAQENLGKDTSQSTESFVCQERCVKTSRAQRQKRTEKLEEQNKLPEEKHGGLTGNCAMLKTPSECPAKGRDSVCITDNDTAALLSQVSLGEESLNKTKNMDTCAKNRKVKDALQSCKTSLDNQTQEEVNMGSANASPREGKARGGKSVARKSKRAKASQGDLCSAEQERSLHDASLDILVDEPSILNSSTVTVSFEDFLQSQKEEEDTAVSETDPSAADKHGSDAAIEVPQLSPKTLTVLAEVHPISPTHDSAKGSELRMASIFSRNKKAKIESQIKKLKSSSSTKPSVSTDILPNLKRKSNVVLLEEDLELLVVESSSSPKCTKEERKQFMNAFKQPSLDAAKGKGTKGSSPPKQAEEKAEAEDNESEEKSAENKPDVTTRQSVEKRSSNGIVKKKHRKSTKKSQRETLEDVSLSTPKQGDKTSEDASSTPKQEELSTSIEVDMESGHTDEGNRQTLREVRRSTREHTRRQTASVPKRNPSPHKARSQEKGEDSAVAQENSAQACTPRTHRKKRVYRAEMVFPLDKRESPIRMKFTRVFPSSATKAGEFEISSPVSVLESNSLKKRNQAKKLIEKAKALRQSKQTAAMETATVRRSARHKESVKTNYCENEDSVVCLEDINSIVPLSEESQKTIRSLNDVLGKKTTQNKALKKATGSKLAPIFLEKQSSRTLAVISVSDDSSCDGPENSQDDEQFRAKREFLKSGLPESFKKQIAKTAANQEAYTQACASFRPVIHVQQRLKDCPVWTLSWPGTPLLSCLKEFYDLPSLVSLERHAYHPTLPAQRTCREKVSGWQEDFPESTRQLLLDKITTSNPSFPVQRFFIRFLKRHKDYSLQMSAETECGSNTANSAGSSEYVGGKRKRIDEEGRTGMQAKKQKSSLAAEEPIVLSDSPDSSHRETGEAADAVTTRRSRRRRSHNRRQPASVVVSTPDEIQRDPPVNLSTTGTAGVEDGVREDVLWTEKYQPQHSSDIVGNMASVRKVHSWLKEWKLRADREERRTQQEKKQADDSNDSWVGDGGTDELEDIDDQLCNTLLITGPAGVGKTAAVYACAQELGFKVFEVNCSSQRSGRQILSQLKEATQSHQVDIQGVAAHKPTYFNSYSSWSSASKLSSSPSKVNSPRRVVSSPRKPPQSPRGSTLRKRGLAPTSLATFFKMGGKARYPAQQDNEVQRVCPKKSARTTTAGCESQEPVSKLPAEESGKKTATSLILFEEVDVIFDDDSGFLAAVKTFMTTTKRPVILTTSDPTFSAVFDGCFDEVLFKAPPVEHVASFLQLLCLAENMRTDTQDLVDLLRWNGCDIRQSLLQLQFWTRSGGRQRAQQGPSLPEVLECEQKREADKVENVSVDGVLHSTSLPPCHTGCTESVLGLLNIQQERNVEDLLSCEHSAVETLRSWDVLSEAERRGVNLLYTNLELLLPLPVCTLPERTLGLQPGPIPYPHPSPLAKCHRKVEEEENTVNMSPLKVSSRMKRKKQQYAHDKNALNSDSESDEGFLSLLKPSSEDAGNTTPTQHQKPPASEAAPMATTRRVKPTDAERKRSKPVSQCLSSLAEYLDDMSFMDSSLHYQLPQGEGACRPQSFNWTGAEIKSGMTDDVRLECGGHTGAFDSKEIHAMLGSLSFCKCRAGISEAWREVQELEEQIRNKAVEELTLPVSSHRQRFTLAQSTPCEPRVTAERREVMNAVLTNRSFSMLGSRRSAALDLLPSLRTICRAERLKEQGRVKRRFMHYFNTIHLDLPKSTLQQLTLDFP